MTTVSNICYVFREFCVYKVIPSHLQKPKTAICVQNSPNMSQTARSLEMTMASRRGGGNAATFGHT